MAGDGRSAQAPSRGTRFGRRPWLRWLALGGAIVILALAMTFLWRTVSPARDRFWERIQATGQWRVGIDPSFPPFETLDSEGKPLGFDVDLANAIAARWGVRAQLESVGFDGLMDAVWASKVDSAISALPYQPQFSQDLAFSRPYFEAGLVLVTGKTGNAITSPEDLAGRRVAVEWGSEGDVQARELRRRFPELQIEPQETSQAALAAVVDGQADAALVDHISALQFAATDGRVVIAPKPVVSDPYVIVLPRKAPLLQRQVEEALTALEADGTLDRLTDKWFGQALAGP